MSENSFRTGRTAKNYTFFVRPCPLPPLVATEQVNVIGRHRNPFAPVQPSHNLDPLDDSNIEVKLEHSRATIRKLSQCLGTTTVTSSSNTENSDSGDNLSEISSVAEQKDHEFASMYTFTTNVS